jgi:hypothetical protein
MDYRLYQTGKMRVEVLLTSTWPSIQILKKKDRTTEQSKQDEEGLVTKG